MSDPDLRYGPQPEHLYRIVGPTGGGPMPLLIMCDGWTEAGQSLSLMLQSMVGQSDLVTIAEFDIDGIVDQRLRRPAMTLDEGVTQKLEWPRVELSMGTDNAGKPFMLLHGAEPDFYWRQFARAVALAADSVGVSRTVLIGAYPAPVPHTRPITVSVTSNNPQLTIGWPHTPGRVTVQAGIHFAIGEELQAHGIDTVGLWAQVPYYVASSPCPHATVGLFETLAAIQHLCFDREELEAQTVEAVAAIAESVERTPGMDDIVQNLEARVDSIAKSRTRDLPSADDIGAQVQEYLREIDPRTNNED